MSKYTVNCSILLTDLPLNERPAAAAKAGFEAVEFWWPFSQAVPSSDEVDAFVNAVEGAGVQLSGLNFFAGDMPAGERGLVSSSARTKEFTDNIEVVVEVGKRLNCKAFNALYGLAEEGLVAADQAEVALTNLNAAGRAVAEIGGTVLLEPVSGAEGYPIKTAQDALDVIAKLDVDNVRLLADFYHMSVNGDDVASVISEHASEFGHVQIADNPGRGEPGTGELPLAEWISAAEAGGYNGWIGLEYKTSAEDPFAWLPADQRGSN